MPRYKKQSKKSSAWRTVPRWGRIAAIVAAVLVVTLIATAVVKKIVSHTAPVYGGVVADEFLSRSALISKLTRDESTLTAYDAELTTLQQLQEENASLKAELGRGDDQGGILADVMTLPNRSFYDTMLIDAGSADGIKVGDVVYAFNSVALGSIISVEAHNATVYLYSAPNRQTSGNAVGSDVAVTLIGRGSGEYEVQLPRDVPFTIGSMIATQSVTPASLAEIERIITDPRDPFQRLLAKVPVNLQALKWVIVK